VRVEKVSWMMVEGGKTKEAEASRCEDDVRSFVKKDSGSNSNIKLIT
jgi:hypothetical protein